MSRIACRCLLTMFACALSTGALALPASALRADAQDLPGTPAPAAKLANATFLVTTVRQAACGRVQSTGTFSVQGTIDDGGGRDQGAITVYDDGVLIASGTFSVPVGATQTFSYDLTVAHTIGAPGVAISIRESVLDPTTVNFISVDEVPTDACPTLRQVVGALQGDSVPVPALAPLGLALLLAALGVLGALGARRSHRG